MKQCVILSVAKDLAVLSLAAAMFVACSDDSGTSANDSSGVIPSEVEESSSSVKTASSSSIASTSSSSRNDNQAESCGDACIDIAEAQCQGSQSNDTQVKSSSSSKDPEPAEGSSSSSLSSSSSEDSGNSSSSEYVPYDHSDDLAGEATLKRKDAYKQFTDARNDRSYYYITITGKDTSGVKDSVTVMAENLNIGDFVWGYKNQKDDTKIERYCYDDDTTKCDMYGGLYQWAEAMALPSRCNTESCADLIEENHRGICPEGWRLLTYNDFYIIWHAETNTSGVKGLRSSYGFEGNNETGYSLTGAGFRTYEGSFSNIGLSVYWFYPVEKDAEIAYSTGISTSNQAPDADGVSLKTIGNTVRCVMVE